MAAIISSLMVSSAGISAAPFGIIRPDIASAGLNMPAAATAAAAIPPCFTKSRLVFTGGCGLGRRRISGASTPLAIHAYYPKTLLGLILQKNYSFLRVLSRTVAHRLRHEGVPLLEKDMALQSVSAKVQTSSREELLNAASRLSSEVARRI